MTQRKEKVNTERRRQRIRGEWILASVSIVIISLLASYFLMNFLNKTGLFFSDKILILLVFFIVIILSAFYTYMRRMPAIYLLKVSGVSIVVLLILSVTFLGLLISSKPSGGPTFWLVKLDYEPEYYVEITPEELEELPTLQGLNNKCTYGFITELKTTIDERNRIIDLLTQEKLEKDKLNQTKNAENIRSFIQNSESYIKIEGEFYRFRIGLVG